MLVLTRKTGEQINIGDDIIISVLEVGKGNVRIGIEAPKQVLVLRHEVYKRIREENIKSASGAVDTIEEISRIWRQQKEDDD